MVKYLVNGQYQQTNVSVKPYFCTPINYFLFSPDPLHIPSLPSLKPFLPPSFLPPHVILLCFVSCVVVVVVFVIFILNMSELAEASHHRCTTHIQMCETCVFVWTYTGVRCVMC